MTMTTRALALAAFTALMSTAAMAQAQQPQIATTKVEGTDNVYVFATATINRCSS